jgi:hypothetical protein
MLKACPRWLSRISILMAEIERGISDRIPVPTLIDTITQELKTLKIDSNSDASNLAFLIARVYKLQRIAGKRNTDPLRDCLETVSFQIDLTSMHASDLSKFLWACATVEVQPLIPDGLGHTLDPHNLRTRDLCTIIWAASKWASRMNPDALMFFEHLLTFIDETRSEEFTREDLVAISRAIANVHNR